MFIKIFKNKKMKDQVPSEAKDIIVNEAEKLIFPKPAKTVAGKILRVFFKISKIFILK